MTLFSVCSLLGAVALFLFGMELLRGGLCRMSQKRLQPLLMRSTQTVWQAILLGAVVTAFVQSSSAVTIIIVGLVAGKVISLYQAAGLIAGANLGTCSTAFLVHFGLCSNGTQLFASPWVLLLLCLLLPFLLQRQCPPILSACAGVAALLAGMTRMQTSLLPLSQTPHFSALLSACDSLFSGLMAGTVVTAVLQSSSACIAMLQTLSDSGALSIGFVLPVLLGQNIGTCVTALLASVHAGRSAQQAALLHLAFNLLGAAVVLPAQWACSLLFPRLLAYPADSLSIACLHLLCNVAAITVYIPLCGKLDKRKRLPYNRNLLNN
ncbi:Na/Pi cotransporter family protein [Butyricicoccus sp.]|uniref:Na/Pi cotransporter family protein n=1 Tax=Butyricicoccus sp. TaxID=2049021 RepID=UPI003F14C7D0